MGRGDSPNFLGPKNNWPRVPSDPVLLSLPSSRSLEKPSPQKVTLKKLAGGIGMDAPPFASDSWVFTRAVGYGAPGATSKPNEHSVGCTVRSGISKLFSVLRLQGGGHWALTLKHEVGGLKRNKN